MFFFYIYIYEKKKKQIPPAGKGSLYIRPLLIGNGPILGIAPAPEYTFIVYACPVGNYLRVIFKF